MHYFLSELIILCYLQEFQTQYLNTKNCLLIISVIVLSFFEAIENENSKT